MDESKVFHAVFQTEHLRLGIGKGGQIYSMRGPFGEGVPPQRLKAPWIDEVWHLVVTNEEIVTPIQQKIGIEACPFNISSIRRAFTSTA